MASLKNWRESKNWTQADLAEKLGVHVQYVSALERGARTCGMGLATRIRDMSDGQVALDDLAPLLKPAA